MAEWDGEGFEPGDIAESKGDAWEGEDEDDDELKENWDDEEEERDKPDETESPTAPVVTRKKKSTVKKRIMEKEEKMKEEMLRKAALKEQEDEDDDDDDEESILASKLAEKVKNQQLVEEADFEVTKDLFGGGSVEEASKSIDTFKPTNKDEFNELAKMIAEKLSQFETSSEYPGFLEVLIRDLATPMEPEDVKKLATVLNTLASEKHRALKAVKGKKKTKKVALGGSNKASKGVDLHDYSTTYGDEYDGFI